MYKHLIFLLTLLFTFSFSGYGQKKTPYVVYNSKGKKVSYSKMIKSFKKSDVVLFGEYHNNPISHWLELEVMKDLASKYSLSLGAEMIEADNQLALNEYLSGKIDHKGLDSTARLWKNYKTDYKPLVDLAKDSGLAFIATNVPRRYARLVSRNGLKILDTLPSEEKAWIASLPIPFDPEIPSYQRMLTMMGDHGSPNIVKAQAIKDATMAHFILQHLESGTSDSPDLKSKFLHFNGAYHSDFHEGIEWYIKQHNKSLIVKTITTVSGSNPRKLDKQHHGRADFIICVDEDMTPTY
jgi:uncharacterized iron-regulated protein